MQMHVHFLHNGWKECCNYIILTLGASADFIDLKRMKNPLVAHHSGVCQNLSDKIQLPSEYQECLEEKGQEVAALDRSQFVVFLEQQQHNSSCWDVRNCCSIHTWVAVTDDVCPTFFCASRMKF